MEKKVGDELNCCKNEIIHKIDTTFETNGNNDCSQEASGLVWKNKIDLTNSADIMISIHRYIVKKWLNQRRKTYGTSLFCKAWSECLERGK